VILDALGTLQKETSNLKRCNR